MTRTHLRRAAPWRGAGLVVALLAAPVLAQEPETQPVAPPQGPALLIKVGKAHTGTGAALAPASLLIRAGLIEAIGPKLRMPKDAVVIDLTHLEAIPALVDPMATTFLSQPDTQGAGPGPGMPTAEGLVSITPAEAGRLVAAGSVTLCMVPGAGPGILAPLTGVRVTPEGVPQVVEELAALHFVFSQDGPAEPFAPLKAWEGFDKALKEADEYRKKKEEAAKALEEYEKKWKEYLAALRKAAPATQPATKPATQPSGRTPARPQASQQQTAPAKPPERPKRPDPFKEDPAKEALVLALEGKIPVRIEARSASEVHLALRLAHEHKLTLVLVEPWEVDPPDLERIVDGKIPVLFGPLDRPQVDFTTLAFSPELLVRLAQAGSPVAIGTGGRHTPRFLLEQAALARGLGLTRKEALLAVTAHAALVSGLGQTAGVLAKGRRADLVFFDGDPLDPTLAPARVMLEGRFLEQEQQP